MEETVFICLGSNSVDAREKLRQALEHILELPAITLQARSEIYQTEPQGIKDQPWFDNQVISIRASGWEARELMEELLAIEASLGRKRDAEQLKFGPRPIDLDILLFGNRISEDPHCFLPHPRLASRAFALIPLLEIDPDVQINGEFARSLLARLDWHMEDNRIYQIEGEKDV